jgi:hypothetical protein
MGKVIRLSLSEEECQELEYLSEELRTSVEEVLKEGLKRLIDEKVEAMEKDFRENKAQYVKLEDWAKSKGLHE